MIVMFLALMAVEPHVLKAVKAVVMLLVFKVAKKNVPTPVLRLAVQCVAMIPAAMVVGLIAMMGAQKDVGLHAMEDVLEPLPQITKKYYFYNKRFNKMTKKLVGQVTVEEKNEILTLFERRNGLNELAMVLTSDNEPLYEKLVKDLGETSMKFQGWWDRMGEQYQWESVDGGNWEIDFATCNIYLTVSENE